MTPTEHHLGDRLAALVDGELGHDARERVLSHLATCWSCKAEADAQRRLKNVFADTAPPPPSDGLLARLQGLPAGGGADSAGRAGSADDTDDTDQGPGGPGAGLGPDAAERGEALPAAGLPGGSGRSPWTFDYLPVGRGGGRSPLAPPKGFRIHEVHRVDRAERAAPRGRRRFAFAAAGAFSLAALAIGGALTSGAAGSSPVAKGEGSGASASPVRSAPSGAASRDNRRRTPVTEHRSGVLSASTAASLSASTFAAAAARGGLPAARSSASSGAPPLLLSSFSARQGPLQQPAAGQLTPLDPSAVREADWLSEADGPETVISTTAPSTTLRSFPGRVPMATAPAGAPSATFAPPGR